MYKSLRVNPCFRRLQYRPRRYIRFSTWAIKMLIHLNFRIKPRIQQYWKNRIFRLSICFIKIFKSNQTWSHAWVNVLIYLLIQINELKQLALNICFIFSIKLTNNLNQVEMKLRMRDFQAQFLVQQIVLSFLLCLQTQVQLKSIVQEYLLQHLFCQAQRDYKFFKLKQTLIKLGMMAIFIFFLVYRYALN